MIINASSRVSLDGQYTDNKGVSFHSGVRSAAGAGNYTQNNMVKGNGGSIQINTGELSLTNGAALDASTFDPSNAGDLEIIARSIRLDKGAITATTNLGNGGNIKLTAQDYILLRNGSKISTNAGTTNRGGNGGNITINN